MADKQRTNWASILQVIGFLCFVGPILAMFADPADRTQKIIQSAVGFVMLSWGTILFYRNRRKNGKDQE
jgi:uncharacterized membrane protein